MFDIQKSAFISQIQTTKSELSATQILVVQNLDLQILVEVKSQFTGIMKSYKIVARYIS